MCVCVCVCVCVCEYVVALTPAFHLFNKLIFDGFLFMIECSSPPSCHLLAPLPLRLPPSLPPSPPASLPGCGLNGEEWSESSPSSEYSSFD